PHTLLLFHSPPDPPPTPSFPTRRSSDLQHYAPLQVLLLPARQRDPQPPRAHAQAHHRRAERAHSRGRARDRHGVRSPAREGECRDRKSTRLNSSHVSISYAVFCLKKKKK